MAPALHIDRMDPALYEAVVEVNAEEYEALLQKVEQLGVTPKGNTILHIAALYGHTHFVQKILEQHSHAASLLCARNKKNETALHIAAMEGHTDVVSALISYAKTCPELESGIGATDILRMMDDDKDTAFNKAVRKGHLEVVKLLVTEDPKFELLANEAGETPLYLAAELLFHKCLLEILNNCERPVYGGPLGRTALHAAIINSATYPYGPSDCTKLLLEKEASLCEVGDDWGWTPLHYAVKLYNKEAVCDILQVKSSAAYIRAGKEGEWTTAIHIAVSEDSVVLFEQILQCCPLCWEMVNSKGQNVLHEAILNNGTEIIKFILDSPKRDHLIDEKDEDGNTPLHLLAATNTYVPELIQHPRLNGGVVFNKQHLTPLDIAYQGSASAAREGHTDVVSALIRYAKTCPELESGIGATDILRMMDDDKGTALHKAVRKEHLEIVKLLVTEDPKFELLANEAGETPLYLAAELQFHECLLEILNNCEEPVYGGPFGQTALRAAIINYEQLGPSALYEALVEGDEDVDDALWHKLEQLGGRQVTLKGNTILHIAALHGHTHLVQKILEQHSHASSLLSAQNKKKETALHISASEGHTDMVSALICYAKTCPELESGIRVTDILRMMDDDKDTALHKAVRKGHLEVVKLLVKEDPEFEFPANEAGETPLYLAAELQFLECLLEILNNCERPVYGGPLGRTALHAAIINSASFEPSDCTKLLLEKEASLCEVADDWGWTPLHYAVKLHNEKAVCDILQVKSSAAYIPAGKEGQWTTAIHIAVSENSVLLFKQILQRCPLCWEMVNSKGRNVLHEAILNDATKIIKFILNSPKRDHLIDEKDEDGDTPLHLAAASNNYLPELIHHPRLKGTVIYNKQNLTPLDIAYQEPAAPVALKPILRKVGKRGQRGDLTKKTKRNACNNDGTRMQMIQKRKDREEIYINSVAKVAKTHILVATLIGTVTFAAGITLPGGFDNNTLGETQGMAILLRKSAFKAFVVTNAIGFVCSIASLIGYIRLVGEVSDTKRLEIVENVGFYSAVMLDLSLIAVVLAFATGMFAVLTHPTALAVGLCISVCIFVLGLISFPVFLGYKEEGLIVSKFKKYVIIKKA